MSEIRTKRLILRQWKKEDLEPFAQLNSDPRVMEYMLKMLTEDESNDLVRRKAEHIKATGWGLWAVSLIGTGEFIGFIGLNEDKEILQRSVVEVGWRLSFDHWGKGYATEGALAALEYGFNVLNLGEVYSWTTETNKRSRSVMRKIGLQHDPKDDFDHPKVPKDHPLIKHVLYRITKEQWSSKRPSCTV